MFFFDSILAFSDTVEELLLKQLIFDSRVTDSLADTYCFSQLDAAWVLGNYDRLLLTDNVLVLPVNTHINFLITSDDVIHSWAVPSLGIKVDAIPGRVNQATVFIKRPGYYVGQCSELCGVGHFEMPINIHAVPKSYFYTMGFSDIEFLACSSVELYNTYKLMDPFTRKVLSKK